MLITPDYLHQQRQMHESEHYGTSGDRYAEDVRMIAGRLDTRDILDYGCGKGTLGKALGWPIAEYDPAIPGKDGEPQCADIVVCTDVMEHVEPGSVHDVLAHMASKARKACLMIIAMRESMKVLPDGRNAHLCLMSAPQWFQIVSDHFRIYQFHDYGSVVRFLGGKHAG